ncbi:MAG: Asp-tRNA(Asn)/Glu-tRNA(Gln) amidotransferase subunit GatC [Elusimicrobia bacterium]|nr:Asp-tRNA(Asn)/Glu-tRNA(Gln) amidotransferase subunit GatC [Elusimicrobiota bacterium]
MGISIDIVRKVARLARLTLTADEAALYQSQLGTVLDHMADLSSVDAAGLAGTLAAPVPADVLREDSPEPFEAREELLANAPEREGSYFKVRKVL